MVTPRAIVLTYMGIKSVIRIIQLITNPNTPNDAYSKNEFNTVLTLNNPHSLAPGSWL